MKHRQHIIICGLAILAAAMLLSRGGASPFAAGIGLAFLLCPIVMGTVMWLLMRKPPSTTSPSEHHEIKGTQDRVSSSGRP